MKWIWANKKYIARFATTIIGGIYALIGFVGTFAPLEDILPTTTATWLKIVISFVVLLVLWTICFFGAGAVLQHKKRFALISANSGHKLFVQYGDLFDENEVLNPSQRRNIIIPVNRCFDTVVDDELVSATSIHGKALIKLYESNKYSEESLDDYIAQRLCNTEYEPLTDNIKPAGNKKRYPLGTVVTLSGVDNDYYFLWALSTFDSNLTANTTMQEYVLATQKLIEACNRYSEGFPVVLPIVGAGLSRTKKSQEDLLSYLVNAFKVNQSEINCDIHIVIHEDIKNDVRIVDCM